MEIEKERESYRVGMIHISCIALNLLWSTESIFRKMPTITGVKRV